MNAPTTDPRTRTPTRKRDQTGTVLLMADAVDSIRLIGSFRMKSERKRLIVTDTVSKSGFRRNNYRDPCNTAQ